MRRSFPRRAFLLLLALAPEAGCKLVDQRTFVAHADAPPVVRVKPGVPAREVPPLLSIRFPASPDEWEGPLKVAVDLARTRKPNVLFTVESAVPPGPTPADDAARLARAAADAEAVAAAIVGDGVDRLQVQLSATTDRSAPAEEVRVFVR